jgi:proteasome lid subunit RPN8/RPN11
VEKIGVVIGIGNLLIDFIEATKESTPAFCSLDHEKVFKAYRTLKQGEIINGWYHTHNGFTTASCRDERTQSYWQAFPDTFSIIIDVRHAEITVWRLGPYGVEEIPFEVTPTIREAEQPREPESDEEEKGDSVRRRSTGNHIKHRLMQIWHR